MTCSTPSDAARQRPCRRAIATVALLICTALAPPVTAEPVPLRDEDRGRLARYHDALGRALERALAKAAPADLHDLTAALAGAPQAPQRADPAGDWQCRTLKVGGMLPLVVYGWFDCRVSLIDPTGGVNGGPVWLLEKLSGSQRTRGLIESDGDQLIYRGAAYVADRTPPDYETFPDRIPPEDTASLAPDIGVLQQVDAGRMRLMQPLPFVESVFNVLEFRRGGG